MSREAFEAWWEEEGQFCRAGGGEYEKTFAFRAYEAARAVALEEAAEVCERIGPVMAESYGPGAECITTADECADAIRALKDHPND